jgi:hypothetical protein
MIIKYTKFRIMKNFNKLMRNALYLVLPLCFFALWYVGCAFTEWVWIPKDMTSSMRFVVMWFGLLAAGVGAFLAAYINRQKY